MGAPSSATDCHWHLSSPTECYLSQIGKPVFYAEYGSHEIGCWMRDPKPLKAADSEKYWMTRLENDQLLEEFNSKEAFRSKTASYNYTLFHRFEGRVCKRVPVF